jgi:hypothetical protein
VRLASTNPASAAKRTFMVIIPSCMTN